MSVTSTPALEHINDYATHGARYHTSLFCSMQPLTEVIVSLNFLTTPRLAQIPPNCYVTL